MSSPSDVDVDEAAQVAVLGDPLAQAVEAVVEPVEHLADRRSTSSTLASDSPPVTLRSCVGILTVTAIGRDLRQPRAASRRRARGPRRSPRRSGRSRTSRSVPRTASSVFRPSPVITSTTRSSGSMSPRSASFAQHRGGHAAGGLGEDAGGLGEQADARADLVVGHGVDRSRRCGGRGRARTGRRPGCRSRATWRCVRGLHRLAEVLARVERLRHRRAARAPGRR